MNFLPFSLSIKTPSYGTQESEIENESSFPPDIFYHYMGTHSGSGHRTTIQKKICSLFTAIQQKVIGLNR